MATNTTIRGREYYRIRRTVGYHYDGAGNKIPIIKAFYGTSKRDAEKKYDAWKEQEILRRGSREYADAPFGNLAQFYCDNVLAVSSRYASSTIRRYTSAYNNWIKPDQQLCNIPVGEIKALDIQLFYNRLPCTKAALDAVHKFMAAYMKWLALNDYCNYVLSGVELPVKRENKKSDGIVTWTDEELAYINARLGNHRLRFFILLCEATGMRISEQLGLKYSDFMGEYVNIERQYYMYELRPPKANSVRQVPLLEPIKQELLRHGEWHRREMHKNHYRSEYVFTSSTGNLLDAHNVRTSLRRFYKSIGIPHKKFHAYRATYCTNLCRAGVPIQIASRLLGHKSVEVTQRYYTDVSLEDKIAVVANLALPGLDNAGLENQENVEY